MITTEIKKRWITVLREKAREYEHPARKRGKLVSTPDIDDICNEIEAFFSGKRFNSTRSTGE